MVTIGCEPSQARKGAAVAIDSGAVIRLPSLLYSLFVTAVADCAEGSLFVAALAARAEGSLFVAALAARAEGSLY